MVSFTWQWQQDFHNSNGSHDVLVIIIAAATITLLHPREIESYTPPLSHPGPSTAALARGASYRRFNLTPSLSSKTQLRACNLKPQRTLIREAIVEKHCARTKADKKNDSPAWLCQHPPMLPTTLCYSPCRPSGPKRRSVPHRCWKKKPSTTTYTVQRRTKETLTKKIDQRRDPDTQPTTPCFKSPETLSAFAYLETQRWRRPPAVRRPAGSPLGRRCLLREA